jgi:hypothetical protein
MLLASALIYPHKQIMGWRRLQAVLLFRISTFDDLLLCDLLGNGLQLHEQKNPASDILDSVSFFFLYFSFAHLALWTPIDVCSLPHTQLRGFRLLRQF